MHEELRNSWMRSLSPYVDHVSYTEASFASLVERHSQDSRHFHTIEHVDQVVSMIEDLVDVPSAAPDDADAVRLAGFFHDIVYEALPTDKEKSAQIAGTWLDGLDVPQTLIAEVQRLILLTSEYDAAPDDRNASVLLDADLSILGSDPVAYDRYREQLRREHSRMSESDYIAWRRRRVQRFLARRQIYRTNVCRSALEATARINLGHEAKELGSVSDEAGAGAWLGWPIAEEVSGHEEARPAGRSPGAGEERGPDESREAEVVAAQERGEGPRVLVIPSGPLGGGSESSGRAGIAPPAGVAAGPIGMTEGAQIAYSRKGLHSAGPDYGRRYLLYLVVATAVVLFLVYALVQWARPAPSLTAAVTAGAVSRVPGAPPRLPWPSQGEAAVEVAGVGNLGSSGGDAAIPVASLTKIMTALVILQDHPISPDAPGPSLTVSPQDVATYQSDVASQQSVVQVTAGEQLSEREAIEGLLVASGNNIATMLATWDSGSESAFVAKMNREATALGLTKTHYVGPSGYDIGDVSTASDEVKLAEAAMQNATLASVVAEPQVTLPVGGTIYNFDYDLGKDGIVGLKTGSSTQAGGCFVFVAKRTIDGRSVSVTGAVLGIQSPMPLTTALAVGDQLVAAAYSSIGSAPLVQKGQQVGTLSAPWAPAVPVEAGKTVSVLAVPGMTMTARARFSGIGDSARSGQSVGVLTLRLQNEVAEVPLVSAGNVSAPSFGWRLGNI
jgi:serine-type D-Ala-D-Ala carboxypeptidase (penicillin-binding protein 5/6)